MKFRLRIIAHYHPIDLDFCDYPPLKDAMFDSYAQVIQWLNTHMGLNFQEKAYKIIITTVEV